MRESSSARDRDRSPRNDRKNWDYKDKIRDKEVGVVCGCLWSCSHSSAYRKSEVLTHNCTLHRLSSNLN